MPLIAPTNALALLAAAILIVALLWLEYLSATGGLTLRWRRVLLAALLTLSGSCFTVLVVTRVLSFLR